MCKMEMSKSKLTQAQQGYKMTFYRFRYTSALLQAFTSSGINSLQDFENRGMAVQSLTLPVI